MTTVTEKAMPVMVTRRRSFSRFALKLRVSGVLVFLLIIGLIFSLLTGRFLTAQNVAAIASNAAILSIVAAAQAIVLLTRNVDVSVGSIMGFTAYLTADYAAHHPGVGGELVVMALVIGLALGLINGLLVAYARVSSLIATLATMSLFRGFTYIYARGQEVTSNKLPTWMPYLVDTRFYGIPLLVVICAVAVAGVAIFLRHYPIGRRIYAVGSNPLASLFYGLRIERVVLLAYGLSGLLCGIAGLLYAARVGTVTVVLATGWEMSSLAAAVIGGVSVTGGSGSVIGAALGALVLATIDNGLVLLGIPEFWRMFIQGSAIVAAAAADVFIALRIRTALQGEHSGRGTR
jgi:rhamnose transport system permease protein